MRAAQNAAVTAADRLESARIAAERFGLTPGQTDYNLHRVIKLARNAFDGSAAGLSVLVGEQPRFLVADGFELVNYQPATPACREVYRHRAPLVLDRLARDFTQTTSGLEHRRFRTYVGLPV